MRKASFTTEDIEMIFFFFVYRAFATLLLLAGKYLRHNELALALAVSQLPAGMIISFLVLLNSILCSIDCIILAFD